MGLRGVRVAFRAEVCVCVGLEEIEIELSGGLKRAVAELEDVGSDLLDVHEGDIPIVACGIFHPIIG